MQIRRRNWFRLGVALLVIGTSFLALPPYSEYCEANNADNYYCAAYSVAVAFSAIVEGHSEAITALATIAIAWFTWTLYDSN